MFLSLLNLGNRNWGEIFFAAIKRRRDLSLARPQLKVAPTLRKRSLVSSNGDAAGSPNVAGGRKKNTVSPHRKGESQFEMPWWFSSFRCSQRPPTKDAVFSETVKFILKYTLKIIF